MSSNGSKDNQEKNRNQEESDQLNQLPCMVQFQPCPSISHSAHNDNKTDES